jgi:FkbM family methyltransferase
MADQNAIEGTSLRLKTDRWRHIAWRLKKPVRTIQSYFPFLKEAKDQFYLSYRRRLRIPSEPFFAAISLFGDRLTGCYVDVGGNLGQSIESIRLYAPDAKIVSFEPNPNLAGKLARRYRNDQMVEIRDVGLSDRTMRLNLHVPSYRGFVYDGLGSLDFDAAKSWISSETVYFFNPRHLVVNSYECAVETLDMQNLQHPIFIKIDVEGTEYQVVKGGIETLRKFEPILLVEGFHEKPDLAALSSSLGYEPYSFDGKSFVSGASETNTFLMTRARMNAILAPPN